MSTTGEKTFSTTNRTVTAPVFKPITPGTYDLTLCADATVGKADRSDAIPYVNVSFAAAGTAASEGGKDRRVFHRFFLGLKPGKDGVINMDRENGLTALAKALGTEIEGVEIIERDAQDADGNETKLEYLNPKQVCEWLKSFAGTTVKGRIKTEKGTGGYSDKDVIAKFLLGDA